MNNIKPLKYIPTNTAYFYFIDCSVPAGASFTLPAQLWLYNAGMLNVWYNFTEWSQLGQDWTGLVDVGNYYA